MKTYKYEFYHQSNLIQIGNLIDDMHDVHVHLLTWQRRYYRMFGGYIPLSRILKHITTLKKTTKPDWKALPSQMLQDVAIRIHLGTDVRNTAVGFTQTVGSQGSPRRLRGIVSVGCFKGHVQPTLRGAVRFSPSSADMCPLKKIWGPLETLPQWNTNCPNYSNFRGI